MRKDNEFLRFPRKGILLVTYLSCCLAHGQLKNVAPDSFPTNLYDDRGKPYEEGILFTSKDPQNNSEHQYLLSLGWIRGTLFFEGRIFEDVDMNYNTYEDILLVLSLRMNVNSVKALKIDQSKVDKFVVNGREFINYIKLTQPPKPYGFYEKYFEGKNLKGYIKHAKTKSASKEGIEYKEQEQIYLLLDETYYEFKSKKSLYDLFPQYKRELKLYMKKYSAGLKRRNLKDLPLVLGYCDQLVNDEK